jgi:beta-glucosidase-like glycosyl hydrolase
MAPVPLPLPLQRYGRTSELPSEDPIHSGTYGAEMVRGMQRADASGHPLVMAHLKHYTVYSREADRMHSEANVSAFDLHDSYLRQYEEVFKASSPSGVMCSYASINGRPAWYTASLIMLATPCLPAFVLTS